MPRNKLPNTEVKKNFHSHIIQWSDLHVSRLWDYYAKNRSYDHQYFSFQAGAHVLDYVRSHIDLDRQIHILDYGCGPGFLIQLLISRLKKGQICYGLDFSKDSVSAVQRRFKDHPRYGGSHHVEALPSPYGDESMEVIFVLDVIEHLNDAYLTEMILEIRRLLKPGGYVVVTTKNHEDLEAEKTMCPECGCIFHRWQHMRIWTPKSLPNAFSPHGFKTRHIHATNFSIPYQRLLKILFLFKVFPLKKSNLIYVGQKQAS